MFRSLIQRKSSPSEAARSSLRPSAPDPTRMLRDMLARAMSGQRYDEALTALLRLEMLEPRSPRWPHKRGDLMRQLGKPEHAFDAYAAAVRRYAEEGHNGRAQAMAKAAMGSVSNAEALIARLDSATQSAFRMAADPDGCPALAMVI